MPLPASDVAPNPWFSWSYVEDNLDTLVAAGQEHVMITMAAMGLSILIAVPLAILVRVWETLKTPTLVVSGLL